MKSPCAPVAARLVGGVKKTFMPLFALLAACRLQADPGVVTATPPAYVDEAPLPHGWPQPGPYDQVSEKRYPAYRAAFTDGKGETSAFWTLFAHIKKNDIPMTAPVEMKIEGEEFRQSSMAFLYQNGKVGSAGPAGPRVEVRDLPSASALSYTWQGSDSKENIGKAKDALDTALAERKARPKGFRLLGYNGPGTPRAKRTWELQALLD